MQALGWVVLPGLAMVGLGFGLLWVAGVATSLLSGNGLPGQGLGSAQVFGSVLFRTHRPIIAWFAATGGLLGPEWLFWLILLALLVTAAACCVLATMTLLRRRINSAGAKGAAWASAANERAIVVPEAATQRPFRLVAGRGERTRSLVAAEDCISAVVFGPNGSGKSTGLIAPNVLEWAGPLLMTTTKVQDVALIHSRRSALGPVWIIAPGGCPGFTTAGWSPVDYATDGETADRMAEWLCEASGLGADPRSRAWVVQARKLIKPLLLAANLSGGGIDAFVRWIYDGKAATEEVRAILRGAGQDDAYREYASTWSIHDEGQGSVLFTAYGLADAYSRESVRATAAGNDVDLAQFFGADQTGTIIVVAPESDTDRFAPLITALIASVVHAAEEAAAASGGPLPRRLLLALDEAGNVFRFPRLPNLLTTARGNGIQLLLVYHDLAQLEQVVGRENARTVMSNAKMRILLPGVGDLDTLRYFSEMLGRATVQRSSVTRGERGSRSTSTGDHSEELAPLHTLQQLPAGNAVVQYQNLPPMRVRLRFCYQDKALTRLTTGNGEQP